jgi:hypothetical protein
MNLPAGLIQRFERLACLALAASALAAAACTGGSAQDQSEAVLAWLTCGECTQNERSFVVDSVGGDAIPMLSRALSGLDPVYRANVAYNFGAAWAELPGATVDSAAYVAQFMANFDAMVQRRAVIVLADFGEAGILRNAFAQRVQRAYRDDVVAELQRALARVAAEQGGPPVVAAAVEVIPDTVTLAVNAEITLAAVVRDSFNGLMFVPVTWVSSDTSVASVNPEADRRGRVRGVGAGTATIAATSAGNTPIQAQAAVTVVPVTTAYQISIQGGNLQEDTIGQALATPLVVRVTNASGAASSNVPVRWTLQYGGGGFIVGRGGGVQSSVTTTTSPAGLASVSFRLGPDARRVAISAEVSGSSVRFSHRALRPPLNDVVPPVIGPLVGPASLPGGATVTFTAPLSDDIGLGRLTPSIDFGATTIQSQPMILGTYGGSEEMVRNASGVWTIPAFMRAIQGTAPTGRASGPVAEADTVRFELRDLGGNRTRATSAINAAVRLPIGGAVPSLNSVAPAIFTPADPRYGSFLLLAPSVPTVCSGTQVACGATPPATLLSATMTGPTSFANPFVRVEFYWRDPFSGRWNLIGSGAPSVNDNAVTNLRTWTYTANWTVTGLANGAGALLVDPVIHLTAIGVHSSGSALISSGSPRTVAVAAN